MPGDFRGGMAGHMTEAPRPTRRKQREGGCCHVPVGEGAQTEGSSYPFCKGEPSSPVEMLGLKSMCAGGNTRG